VRYQRQEWVKKVRRDYRAKVENSKICSSIKSNRVVFTHKETRESRVL